MPIQSKEITLEGELEGLLQWRRDCYTDDERRKEADTNLFVFSVGLLCGLKEDKRRMAAAERRRQMEEWENQAQAKEPLRPFCPDEAVDRDPRTPLETLAEAARRQR